MPSDHSGAPIRAAIIDVDDTLYPQSEWLEGVWRSVADRAAARYGVAANALFDAVMAETAAGSDRGGLLDRALAAVGRSDVPVRDLVAEFHAYRPVRLEPYPGAIDALQRLAAGLPAGVTLLSDGEPGSQDGKIDALGVRHLVRGVVLSDTFGREHRKPDPLPFRAALELLGVPAEDAVVIGDRPGKDVAGALAVGARAIRVRTGEYASQPAPGAWLEVDDFPAAVEAVLAGRHR